MLFAQWIGLCGSRLEYEAQIGISLYFFNATPEWFDVVGHTKEDQFPHIKIRSISYHKLFSLFKFS